ncbi:hypothetical protein ACFFRK_08980 [Amorphoplanes digitatis]|nr:hypothetical protein [Actinoplanes digitatis]
MSQQSPASSGQVARVGVIADARGGRGPAVQCLRCGQAEFLTRVPVIYRDGRVEVSVRGQAFGTATGVVPIRARAVRVTPLARMLAPPRRPRSAAVPAISLGVVGFFFLVVLNIGVASEGGFGVWPAAMALLVLGALCGAMVWSRRRSTRATGRDVGRARWLWDRCWYCHRCGYVSLLVPTVVSQLLPAADLAASLFETAGRLQWQPAPGRVDSAAGKAR